MSALLARNAAANNSTIGRNLQSHTHDGRDPQTDTNQQELNALILLKWGFGEPIDTDWKRSFDESIGVTRARAVRGVGALSFRHCEGSACRTATSAP